MVVSREDALRNAEERDREPIQQIERKLDDAISKQVGTADSTIVSVGEFPPPIIERAKQAYESAGWTVKIESGQRDGKFIVPS